MAVAILFLLPQTPVEKSKANPWNDSNKLRNHNYAPSIIAKPADDKYTMLDQRPPTVVESSFKHYPEDGPPEVINVTSSGGTILPPDQVKLNGFHEIRGSYISLSLSPGNRRF